MLTHADLDALQRDLYANSFREFVKWAWPLIVSDRFVSGYHIDAICQHLQAVADNHVKNLCINVAVRHSKSLLCSVLFPVWLWIRSNSAPKTRILTSTYSSALTVRDAIRSRQLMEHPKFKRLFPIFTFSEVENRKDAYKNSQGGHRISMSIGSRTSGFDADVIVADDIHDFATRTSNAKRTEAIDYFETSLCSRLVRTGREAVVLAGHRVHEDDVYAMLRAKYGDDGEWTWLVLPEEFSPQFATWFNGIGWRDKRTDGELLWPERYGAKEIIEERKRYRYEYSAIFLQEPTPAEGSLFKAEWFRHYSTATDDGKDVYVLGDKRQPKANAWRFATLDTAISTEQTADYTVCQVWDVIGDDKILVDQLRKRLDGSKMVPTLYEFFRTHQPQFLAVETEFVGKFVIDQLRTKNVLVKPFRSKNHGNKETRAIALEIELEAGHVWFPADKSWVGDLEKEMLGFPNASHDDQVDCGAMACILATKYKGNVQPAPLTAEERQERDTKNAQDRFTAILNAGRTPWGF